MNDAWLILVFSEARPHHRFRISKNRKSWWLIVRSREEAVRIKREILVPQNLKWKCEKVAGKAQPKAKHGSRGMFVRRPHGGPIFQVIDGDADPRAAMIAAYRKLEWQREQAEFTASAPQPASTPLPEPKDPPGTQRIARSAAEDLTMRLMREGKIPR